IKYNHPTFNEFENKFKEKALRSLIFCLTIDSVKYEEFVPDDKIKDTIWSRESDRINFFPFSISKPGVYYLSGNIIDEILFDTIQKSKNEKLPGYKISSFVSKKIIVVNK